MRERIWQWIDRAADIAILLVALSFIPVSMPGCPGKPPGPVDPPPPPAPQPKPDPIAATVRLRFGSSGCTATLTDIRDANDRVIVITAAHCVGGVGATGEIRLKDGRSYGVRVLVRERTPDVAIMVANTSEKLPFARVARENAQPGTKIWHMGYGVDRPGNREDGVIVGAETGQGQCQMNLSASSGDSGSGIFRDDTGELISVVCCGSGRGLWGANVVSVRRALDQALRQSLTVPPWQWEPIPLPKAPGNVPDIPPVEGRWQNLDPMPLPRRLLLGAAFLPAVAIVRRPTPRERGYLLRQLARSRRRVRKMKKGG